MPNQVYQMARARMPRGSVVALFQRRIATALGLWLGLMPLGLRAEQLPNVTTPVAPATALSGRAGAGGRPAQGGASPAPRKYVLASLDDAKAIEKRVRALLPQLSRAVVAVEVGAGSGSGVVVSEEGLVLTAAHVGEEANQEVRFTFPDGRTARGKTLGMNHALDAGLMQITQSGPWPHVEMGELGQVAAGDWVLSMGHPGGFDPDRSLVVRLGRMIRVRGEMLQSDCTITAGDSGGPLFDMQGRVIGIHSRISDSAADNFHVSIGSFRSSWDRLLKGEVWGDGRTPRPWFGVRGVDHSQGCRLVSVEEEGPASKAGLQAGDIIRKLNTHPVPDYSALKRLVAEAKPGEEMKVQVQRDGRELSVVVKLGVRSRRR